MGRDRLLSTSAGYRPTREFALYTGSGLRTSSYDDREEDGVLNPRGRLSDPAHRLTDNYSRFLY